MIVPPESGSPCNPVRCEIRELFPCDMTNTIVERRPLAEAKRLVDGNRAAAVKEVKGTSRMDARRELPTHPAACDKESLESEAAQVQ